MLSVTAASGFGATASAIPPSITYLSNHGSGIATNYTFSSITLGVGKIVVVSFTSDHNTITGVTVDGNAASAVVSLDGSGAPAMRARVWQYNGNTAATGDIVVTNAGAVSFIGIGVWLLVGMADAIHDSATVDLTGGATMALTMTIPAGGCGIAAVHNDNYRTLVWTNLDEQYDLAISGTGTYYRHSGASKLYSTLQTDLAVVGTMSGTGGGEIGIAASWAVA